MKKLLPLIMLTAGSSVMADAGYLYNSADGSCMSRPYSCEAVPGIAEEEAFNAVGAINGSIDGGSHNLIRGANDVKVNGESCYTILAGESLKDGFELATTYAVGMHSGTVYRYDIVSKNYHPVRLIGTTVVDDAAFNMIPLDPETRFLTTSEGKIPFLLKLDATSIIIEASDKHWSQKFSVPVVKADFWQIFAYGKIFIAFSVIQSDFKEDSTVLELTPQGFKNAGFFSGTIKGGSEDKIRFSRKIAMGNTIWEGSSVAEMTEGIFQESAFFCDFTDLYHENSQLKLNRDLRLKKVDIDDSKFVINGYLDEKAGSSFIFERFYPAPDSSLIENVSSVYYTIQDGSVILKSAQTGDLAVLDHSVTINQDEGPVSVLEGLSFDELFTIE